MPVAIIAPIGLPLLLASSNAASDTTLGGRRAIWQAAWRAATEVPLFGAGAGGFRRLVPIVIPYPPWTSLRPVDDAHALALDLLLTAGVGGLCAVGLAAALLLVRLGAAHATAHSLERRREASAWLAALGAHWVWSLGDSLPPGSPGFVVLCSLSGLALSFVRTAAARHPERDRPRPFVLGLVLGALGLALLAATPAGHDERRLWRVIADERLPPRLAADCDDAFLRASLLHRALGKDLDEPRDSREGGHDSTAATRAAEAAIDCGPGDLGRLAALHPYDVVLAARATERWPTVADAWRWRAAATDIANRPERRRALWRVVALASGDARSWLALGDAFAATHERSAALDAYTVACRLGDPGANACLRGGHLAAALGRPESARRLYRSSRWPPLRERAELLPR